MYGTRLGSLRTKEGGALHGWESSHIILLHIDVTKVGDG